MSMPFYVSPEQVMKDRADYARKGIARGRSLVAFSTTDGIVIVAENPSRQEGPEVECRVNEIRLRQSPVTCWESAHRAPLPGVALPVRNGGGSTTSTCLPWQTRIDSSRYLPSVRSGIDVQPPAV
mgnify:CR=1 FL=1